MSTQLLLDNRSIFGSPSLVIANDILGGIRNLRRQRANTEQIAKHELSINATPTTSNGKKTVVFSQDLEEYCETSPQKIDSAELRHQLTKTAKKGILLKGRSASSCNQLMKATRVPSQRRNVNFVCYRTSSETSIMEETDVRDVRDVVGKPRKVSHFNTSAEENRGKNATSQNQSQQPDILQLEMCEDEENSDALSLSIDNDLIPEPTPVENLLSLPRATKKKPFESCKMSTPINNQAQINLGDHRRIVSFSDIVPSVEVPDFRKNQSSISGTLNDIPIKASMFAAMKNASKSSSQNDLGLRLPSPAQPDAPRRRASIIKSARPNDNSGVSSYERSITEEKTPLQFPKINSYSPFTQTQFFLPDLKAGSKPLISGFITTPKVKVSQILEATEHRTSVMFPKSLSVTNIHHSNDKLITTANHAIIKSNFTLNPSKQTPSRASPRMERRNEGNEIPPSKFGTTIQLNSNKERPSFNVGYSVIKESQPHQETPKEAPFDGYFIKDGNQVISYSLSENTYMLIDVEQSILLEGSSFCKLDEESLVITGGCATQNKQNNLVSSKVTIINVAKGDKETVQGMPIARYNHTMICSDKTLFVIGGQSFEGKMLKSCYVLDLGSRSWLRIPSLRFERAHSLCFKCSKTGNIYVMGGINPEGEEIASIEKFNQQKCVWQLIDSSSSVPFRSRDAIMLGNITTKSFMENEILSEEALFLVKSVGYKSESIRYSLYSFNLKDEVLTKKDGFRYETTEPGVVGFLAGRNICLGKKGRWGLMDVYSLDSRKWSAKQLMPNN